MARPQLSARTGPGYALAEFINANWDARVSLTHEEIAVKMGYSSPNAASLWKTGKSRVPLDRLPALADLMGVDLAELLPLWMEQHAPDTGRKGLTGQPYSELQEVFSRIVTKSEHLMVEAFRRTLIPKVKVYT